MIVDPPEIFDLSEVEPSTFVLCIIIPLFFVFFILQTLAFSYMGKQGLPYKGGVTLPDSHANVDNNAHVKDMQVLSFSAEIPNYLAMSFVGFVPCRFRL